MDNPKLADITLRDIFAAVQLGEEPYSNPEGTAEDIYRMADLMLAARSKSAGAAKDTGAQRDEYMSEAREFLPGASEDDQAAAADLFRAHYLRGLSDGWRPAPATADERLRIAEKAARMMRAKIERAAMLTIGNGSAVRQAMCAIDPAAIAREVCKEEE